MCMKLAGFLLLLAGWAIVAAAVVLLLPANARTIFVLAGVGVEIIGLTLAIRSNPLAGRGEYAVALHVIVVAGRQWNWLARAPFFSRGMDFNASALSLAACLQIFSVGLAALIPLGACLDRWKLSAACASTALLAGCT